jgi:hypothetical protein
MAFGQPVSFGTSNPPLHQNTSTPGAGFANPASDMRGKIRKKYNSIDGLKAAAKLPAGGQIPNVPLSTGPVKPGF